VLEFFKNEDGSLHVARIGLMLMLFALTGGCVSDGFDQLGAPSTSSGLGCFFVFDLPKSLPPRSGVDRFLPDFGFLSLAILFSALSGCT
jgi:hypothetical protein